MLVVLYTYPTVGTICGYAYRSYPVVIEECIFTLTLDRSEVGSLLGTMILSWLPGYSASEEAITVITVVGPVGRAASVCVSRHKSEDEV